MGQGVFPGQKSKGVALLLQGRCEFMEKYGEPVRQLIERGFHVVSMDWRGQGLSIRELANRQKGYITTFEDYLADLRILFDRHVKPLNLPVTIFGHSMGGHLGLRFIAESACEHDCIQKAVFFSPMVDIHTEPVPRIVATLIADFALFLGLEEAYVPGGGDYDPDTIRFENNRLTRDPEMFRIEHDEIRKEPALALGGVTWGWLKAAFASIKQLNTFGYASQIRIPVMILSAGEDRVVSNRAQKKIGENIPDCTFISLAGAQHEILFETR